MGDIRIQDDLYEYVNHDWLEKAVIPDDKPTTGGFANLSKEVEEILMKDFKDLSKSGNYPDKYMKEAVSLYKLVLDTKKRDEDGVAPVEVVLSKIDGLKDIKDLNANLAEMVRDGIMLPVSVSVDADMMDTTHHCVMVSGPETILPDTTYYKEEMAAQRKALTKAWSDMAKAVLAKTSLAKKKQGQYIKDALAFDELVAAYVKSSEEWSEYTKMYNPMPLTKVSAMVKPLAFTELVAELFGEGVDTIIVNEPRYFKAFKKVFNKDTFELYKHWAYVRTLLGATGALTEELRDTGSTYRRTLTGVAAIPTVEKYAYQLAGDFFSEPVGLYYGKKYFGEEAKKDVIEMVKEIVEIYKKRVKENDFLSEATKEKAILKLNKMGLKMAYPDKVNELYDLYSVDESKSLYENVCAISRAKRLHSFEKITKPVDRTEWVMPGHLVNACFNPFLNDITFPAAILQAPFYSLKQTRSQNLGGIGAVIAHEISHAFDNNGAKCDENGNLKNWWTAEDFKKFNARTKAMVKEFDGIELPWGKVNGKFIVSENIADNGGMAATLDIMSHMDGANYEEYFMNWARVWCMKAKEEYLKLILSIDVHAPAILRANMQPRNFDEWYETFNVKKTDKMYLAPSKRVHIW